MAKRIMGKQSIALWASGVLHCGRAECSIVGEQSVALWASGVLHCGRAERCTVGEQSFALWANRVYCIVGEQSVALWVRRTRAPLSPASSPSSTPSASRPSYDSPSPVASSLPWHYACSWHTKRDVSHRHHTKRDMSVMSHMCHVTQTSGLDIGYVPAGPHAFLRLSGQFGPPQFIFHWPEGPVDFIFFFFFFFSA